ncbi:hypothetical protein ASE76_05340 [Xylophilus sp. Leaf220]|nr:hypothetical protein ASE76_05340 [Xylophilus sp. Leaf220]
MPVPAPAPTPIASTGSYREASVGIPVGPLTYLNSLGSEGFTPVRTWQVNSRGVMADAFMLAKDSARPDARLQFRVVQRPAPEAMLALLNAQGAAGFAYKTVSRYVRDDIGDSSGVFFVADLSRRATYGYETLPAGSPIAKEAFLSQLNAQGARGFRFSGFYGFVSPPGAHLYSKASDSSATYAYTFEAGEFANDADMLQRLNAQGATGLLYRGRFAVDDARTFVQVYEKSSLQAGALEYRVETPRQAPAGSLSPLAFVTATVGQANDMGAQGFFYLAQAEGPLVFSSVYVKNAVVGGLPAWDLPLR